MAHYYLDSSALVKRYVAEVGTLWVGELCDVASGHTLYTVRVSAAEIIAALFRCVRVGSLSLSDAQAQATQFRADLVFDYQMIEVTGPVVDAAMTLAERYGLRGYDAIQLAGALELQKVLSASSLPALTFVCADTELNTVAAAERLPIEDPNSHP